LRKLFKVQSRHVCADVTLHRQGLKLNSSENVPPYTGYITMHSNSFNCFRGETTDGWAQRQTDRHKCLLCVYRILFACIDITSGLAETRNLDAYVKK
jgi:hypothetical protein